MRMVHNTVLDDRYDVITVGAGIGGLTAAALLAKKGLKVLVLEQHYIPGGCCSAIRRQGVTMDVGAAMLFGFGETGYAPHRFVMNELEEEIDMIPHDSIYRLHVSRKKSITFWKDMNRFLDEIATVFPHQDKEIRALYDDFKDFYKALMLSSADVPSAPPEADQKAGLKLFMRNPGAMAKLIKYMLTSEETILKKYISDPKLMCVFDFLTGTYTCCNATESPALLAATMFIDNHVGGACYPAGSPQMLPNKLEKSIERNGGQVAYRHLVSEILIWQNTAYGVRLDDGTEIMADTIVANLPIWNLYGKFINPRHIKPKRMDWAQSFDPTYGTLILYMAVKAEAIPEGARHIEMFAENIYDFSGPNYTAFIPSMDDPSICPPGTHSITVIVPTKRTWPRPTDPHYQSEEYQKAKAEEADIVLEKMEKRFFPKLRENIISLDVATPATLERYTLRTWGNVGGPKLTLKQHFFNRLRARSDWKNLYCVGDSTAMGEGVVASTVSAVSAVQVILKDQKMKPLEIRPYPRQYVNLVEGKPWEPVPDPSEPITEASARIIARECQHCDKPQCREACPASIETCLFARRVEAGNFIGAARAVRDMNPFSEVCGHICPSERLCEKSCSRHDFSDTPVRIRELHGWVCNHVSKAGRARDLSATPNGHKVAVVGAGPAGLTCAHFLARLGYRVDIMEKEEKPGGMLSHTIPTFRLPEEAVGREIDWLSMSGMRFQYGKALGKDFTVAELSGQYDAVFLAPGLWSGRSLSVPGKKGAKVTDALKFLKDARVGKKAKVGKHVVVVGGGSVAADAASVARELGAEKVTLVCLESLKEMPCLPSEVEEMKEKGVEIHNGWGPKTFVSDTVLAFKQCTSVFDDAGRFAPRFDEIRTIEITFDQVILAIGQTVEPSLARYLAEEFGTKGQIEVDPGTMAVPGRPGVFAGGDIIRGAGTVVQSVGDGRRAARAIDYMVRDN